VLAPPGLQNRKLVDAALIELPKPLYADDGDERDKSALGRAHHWRRTSSAQKAGPIAIIKP